MFIRCMCRLNGGLRKYGINDRTWRPLYHIFDTTRGTRRNYSHKTFHNSSRAVLSTHNEIKQDRLMLEDDSPIYVGISKQYDRFCLRPANPNDLDDVIEMSKDVYNGFDYMAPLFMNLYEDANSRMLMVDLLMRNGNKRAIGLFVGTYVPVDDSVFVYGWRIHRDYRGRGIGMSIKTHFYQYLQDVYDFKYFYALRSFKPGWDRQIVLSQKAEFAASYFCLYYNCSPRQPDISYDSHILQCGDDISILSNHYNWNKSCLQQEVFHFLQTHSYNGYLIHSILSIPLEVNLSNINTMFQSSTVTLTRGQNRKITGTTFGYVTEKPLDELRHLDILYYGINCTETLVKHVCTQIGYQNISDTALVLTVQVPYSFDIDKVQSALYPILGQSFQIPPPYNNPRMVVAKYTCKEE